MVRRVCRELGNKKNIVVINDEAHHCYRRKPRRRGRVKLTGDERKEAEKRDEEARVWITGLEAVKRKIGVKAIYDLSATPFFLRGSGYPRARCSPGSSRDFSLIDAIEAGIVKVPRVPVADDSMTGDQPTYRDLWLRIREDLPKKGRKTDDAPAASRSCPPSLQGALHSLYGNYEKYYAPVGAERRGPGQGPSRRRCSSSSATTPTSPSWSSTTSPAGRSTIGRRRRRCTVRRATCRLFSNVDETAAGPHRPNTILVD